MQATAIRSELTAALGLACRVIDRRSSNPVLQNVALVERGGTLTAIGTNLDREITVSLPGSPADAGFATTINAHAFRDADKKAPSANEIEISHEIGDDDAGKARIGFGKLAVTIPTLPYADFPDIAMSPDIHADFTLSRADVLAMLDAVQFAISTEETRYYLNGIYMHSNEAGKLCFVATDGYRLALHEIDAPDGVSPNMMGVIIPRQSCDTLRDLVKAKAGDSFRFEVNCVKIRVTVGNVTLVTKLIDCTFPNYRRVMPVRNDKVLTFKAADAIKAVKAVSVIVSKRGNAVKATIMEGSVVFSVNNPDCGTASQEIAATYDGRELEIGWNARYLLDILDRIEGDSCAVALDGGKLGNGSPCMFRDGVNTFVLMPMRV